MPADHLVIKETEVLSLLELGIIEEIFSGLDHAAGNRRILQLDHELVCRPDLGPLRDQIVQCFLVLLPGSHRAEPWVLLQIRAFHYHTKVPPLLVVLNGQGYPAVLPEGWVDTMRCHTGVTVAHAGGYSPIGKVVQHGRAEERDTGLDL